MSRSHLKTSPQAQSSDFAEASTGQAVLDRVNQSSKLGTRSERVGSERSEEIDYYYCGCPPRSALILTLIEGFELASIKKYHYKSFLLLPSDHSRRD